MIYLFAGDDSKRKLVAYEDFIKSIPVGVEILKFNRNNFSRTEIENLYSSQGLFSQKSMIVFSNIFEHEDERDFILDKLPVMMEAANSFVFLDGKLNKATLDVFRKVRSELNIFELTKDQKEKYDNFLLANAFANRDKLNSWICFRTAVDRGVALEELSGILSWKIKDMLLKKNFGKFKEEELKDFSMKLAYLLPEARGSGQDAESAFEVFLLEAF